MGKSNSDVNPQQNGVYKTNRVVLELLNKIHIAPPEEGPLFTSDSKIGIRMVDYSKEPSIVVEDNLTVSDLLELYEESKMKRGNYTFSKSKIFGTPDEKGLSIARKILITRQSKMANGDAKKSPWYVKIENGKGIRIENTNGSAYMKADSFTADKTVYTNLSDSDFFDLMLQMEREIRMLELAYGPDHVKQNQLEIKSYTQKWQNKAQTAPAGKSQDNASTENSKSTKPVPNAGKNSQKPPQKTPPVKEKSMDVTFVSMFADAGNGCLYAQVEIKGGKKGLIFFEKKNHAFIVRQKEIKEAMDAHNPIQIKYRINKTENENEVYFVA